MLLEYTHFMTLFRGRTDAYGSEEGGCVKSQVTPQLFQEHLDGVTPLGIYPMFLQDGEWVCVWGCSDIDIDDLSQARALQEALNAAGVYAHVERSRSKGYHVWVFADQPVPAWAMRRMLLCAHQVANIPAREVNPKQETLQPNQFGNYVRLPYYDAVDEYTIHRRVWNTADEPMGLAEFVGAAMAHRTSKETIMGLAALWREPERKHVPIDLNANESLSDAMRLLSPLGKVIWRDGPLPQRDRSSTLTKLAYECAKTMSPTECKMVLQDADRRWGKYHLRPNGELEIDKLVVRVYSR